MMRGRTRVVVVGGGRLGSFHLAKLAAMPQVLLAGVVDTCPRTAAAQGARYQIAAASRLRDLPGSLDAAIIASPTHTHLAVGAEALGCGLSVLMEKPLADCPASARALVEQAAAVGAVLQVGHVERFNPAVEVALRLACSPRALEARRQGPFSGRSTDIDVIFDLMVHDLELAATLARGTEAQICAAGERVVTPLCDVAEARLTFRGGLLAQLYAGRASSQICRTLTIACQDHTLEVDCQARRVLMREHGGRPRPGRPLPVPDGDPLSRQDADFIACVREGRRPRVDGAQALMAVQLAARVQAALSAAQVAPAARRPLLPRRSHPPPLLSGAVQPV